MSEELKKALVGCGAILYGDFTLASGKKSKYYIDIKKATTDPKVLGLVADLMAKEMGQEVQRIAGVALGSVPLAVALSLRTGIPFVMVRKEKKDHGTGKLIEGQLDPGEKVLVVEDVITSAGSAVYAVETLRQAGAVVDRVMSVVDREEGGREVLKKMEVEMKALLTASKILGN
ncbi:MAG: orotate phosphoribosyltransferase [Methanomassiliicoccales archaeon]|nr:orotate phosphoribosyltransferase [Methanomassiliicoccales archaeon]